ncbi:MAG: spore maturation protein A [Clostridia bacterium]|nr:spore maturation protein A [Clostridia bacterium]
MLGILFSIICILSFVWSIFAGTTADMAAAVLDGAGRAVEVTLSLIGVMSLWSGVMEVLREAGGIGLLAKLLRPAARFLFPTASRTGKGLDAAVACIAANLLGIGNAATPLGIEAIREMQDGSDIASDDAVMLTVLNTASFSLLPTTVIALRRAAGASLLFELLPAVWMCSGVGTLCAVGTVKLLCAIGGKKHG